MLSRSRYLDKSTLVKSEPSRMGERLTYCLLWHPPAKVSAKIMKSFQDSFILFFLIRAVICLFIRFLLWTNHIVTLHFLLVFFSSLQTWKKKKQLCCANLDWLSSIMYDVHLLKCRLLTGFITVKCVYTLLYSSSLRALELYHTYMHTERERENDKDMYTRTLFVYQLIQGFFYLKGLVLITYLFLRFI